MNKSKYDQINNYTNKFDTLPFKYHIFKNWNKTLYKYIHIILQMYIT